MRVKGAEDGEASIFRVYTPDGDSIFFQKQLYDDLYTQVEPVPNATGRYRVVQGAQGYERLNQATKALREEYAESKKDTDPTPPETKQEKPKSKKKEAPKKAKSAAKEDAKKEIPASLIKLAEEFISLTNSKEVSQADALSSSDRTKKQSALLGKVTKLNKI